MPDQHAETPRPTSPPSLLEALEPYQRAIVHTLAEAFAARDAELYLVGGPVRDLLLEQTVPSDLDFATSVPPSVTREIAATVPNIGLYDVGEKFGTIGIVMPSALASATKWA